MGKIGWQGGTQKKTAAYKRKNKATGGNNYVTVEDRKKQKMSPPSITAAAAAAAATSTTTTPSTVTTIFSSPSSNTLPERPPQRKTAARATKQIQYLTEDDVLESGSMVDPNEAFINGVYKDLRLKTVDKDKLFCMAIIHIFCIRFSPKERSGRKQAMGWFKSYFRLN